MKIAAAAIVGSALASSAQSKPTADERYPYNGPDVPIGDWVDKTVEGNGKGFPRLVEPPAVKPARANPSNNVNVISLSYAGNGVNIHYQTPFGLGASPSVAWGTSAGSLTSIATGSSRSYDRTPPCSRVAVTQCSQFYHDVQIRNLSPDTTYYYKIPAANGTTASEVLSFKTAREAGSKRAFTVAVLNDMGYTNAGGTFRELNKAVDEGVAFAWHGGDISYADDWFSGILPCASDWPVCYNGTGSELPGGVTPDYETPLPAGEVPNQGGPRGGDMSVLYESNWDLWQQWINGISMKVPYMVLPGNHEAACAEFDGPGQLLASYLNRNEPNSTSPKSNKLTYYSCPPSQRNYTAYQHRFRMPGRESGGVTNFWYSFDYGLAHFISFNGETDYPYSPEWPFSRDVKGGESKPKENETFITDSGPFGAVDGSIYTKESYEQYRWLEKDLASVDREKTPWVIAMSHRPMYSSQVSAYQKNMRDAFEGLFLKYGVDAYLSGHIHWYERTFPLGNNGTIDKAAIINNNTYRTNPGKSITHIINGMAGNIESHSTLSKGQSPLNITCVLDQSHYGFSKLTIHNETVLTWSFVKGSDGSSGDDFTLVKKGSGSDSRNSTMTSQSGIAATDKTTSTSTRTAAAGGITTVTEVVNSYTTYCPGSTTFTQGPRTYVVSEATTLTITDCPCTLTHTKSLPSAGISSAVISGNRTAAPSGNVPDKTEGGSSLAHLTSGGQQPTPAGPTSSPVGAAGTTASVLVAQGGRVGADASLVGFVALAAAAAALM
ncbi:Acid phosphatase [Metarhizium brunneum]|uniref:Purple acid phosphatase n=1 Tax=Metarhizium brunneum TaxID=500148 RepID=A0A7D5UX75_9HYPO